MHRHLTTLVEYTNQAPESKLDLSQPENLSALHQYCLGLNITLNSEFKLLRSNKVADYLKNHYFIVSNNQKNYLIIASLKNLNYLQKILPSMKLKIDYVKVIDHKQFANFLESKASKRLTRMAISSLLQDQPEYSAFYINYPKMVAGSVICLFTLIASSTKLFNVINILIYLIQNILKIALFGFEAIEVKRSEIPITMDAQLPIYSILVPLYQEVAKVNDIINALAKLDYPKNKLDVKIIVEADDVPTLKALSIASPPAWVHVIKVPYSLPRTKPKALNYALNFIKGEYVTIYDAEDEPEPQQLRKVIDGFTKLPAEYICLQAKLNFYNASKNLLTRLFSIEYYIWFEHFLASLSKYQLIIPLGGTSNHFKAERLKEIGGWDPFNVTEDAELGIRLYLKGYKTGVIDSVTFEEAPSKVSIWLAQRARWVKGFIQTSYIFFKLPKNYQQLSVTSVIVNYIFVVFTPYCFLLFPWLILILFSKLPSMIFYLWWLNSICSIIYMYTTAYFVITAPRYLSYTDITPTRYVALMVWPFYFILHTIASYQAFFETLVEPFKWNKTPHGDLEDKL